MDFVSINCCLNASSKFYGLSAFGVVVGCIVMLFIWIIFSMPFGIMASLVGYTFGHGIGVLWHNGLLQRFVYWYFPIAWLFGGSHLPPSYNRKYI